MVNEPSVFELLRFDCTCNLSSESDKSKEIPAVCQYLNQKSYNDGLYLCHLLTVWGKSIHFQGRQLVRFVFLCVCSKRREFTLKGSKFFPSIIDPFFIRELVYRKANKKSLKCVMPEMAENLSSLRKGDILWIHLSDFCLLQGRKFFFWFTVCFCAHQCTEKASTLKGEQILSC